mmetsp:Transcript_3051/g.10938  ORF Transcript_3051/g.10938 Transcript_3051/m.10938 type:complete len:180 (+) Transcript_3051:859-1398(+)
MREVSKRFGLRHAAVWLADRLHGHCVRQTGAACRARASTGANHFSFFVHTAEVAPAEVRAAGGAAKAAESLERLAGLMRAMIIDANAACAVSTPLPPRCCPEAHSAIAMHLACVDESDVADLRGVDARDWAVAGGGPESSSVDPLANAEATWSLEAKCEAEKFAKIARLQQAKHGRVVT